jgi:pSer/pThr/pTyr-binding forkhead associated (FHA) protein
VSELRVDLTALVDGQAVARESFKGPEISCVIGRGEGTDFRVISHGVSRKHCKIATEGGGLILTDLGSANGTYVAGQRVSRRALVGEGEFAVCSCVIRYSIKTSLPEGADRLMPISRQGFADLTMQVTPKNLRKETRRKVVRPALRGHLVRRAEGSVPTRVVLLHKATMILGAGEGADHPLPKGARVSALVLRADSLFHILDVSPKCDSVKVNGEARATAPLYDQDELEVAGTTFLYRDGFPRKADPPTQRWSRGDV